MAREYDRSDEPEDFDPDGEFEDQAIAEVNGDPDYALEALADLVGGDTVPPPADINAACLPEFDAYSAGPAALFQVAVHGVGRAREVAWAHLADRMQPLLQAAIERRIERIAEEADEERQRQREEFLAEQQDRWDAERKGEA